MFSGSMVAIVTPMTADGGLDWPAWDRLLDFHAGEGTAGIVVAGTTGESPALSADEIEELTRRAVGRSAASSRWSSERVRIRLRAPWPGLARCLGLALTR